MAQTSSPVARALGAITAATLVAVFLVPIPASAAPGSVTVGDYVYSYDDADVAAGATITDYVGSDTMLAIPGTVIIGPDTYIVTSIGDTAFLSDSLTSVTLPDSITTIGYDAFWSNSLTSLSLPDSLTIIGEGAFYNNAITSLDLPDSVTTIGDSAFWSNSLASVTLGTSVFTIGHDAFYGNGLTSLDLPNSVTIIGDSAFASNSLASVTFGTSVSSIGINAFSYNAITSLDLPDSVTTIGDSAFTHNLLTSVTIPDSVTTIDAAAFYYNSLTSVTIPNSVTTIGEAAFSANPLTDVLMQGPVPSYFGFQAFGVGGGATPVVSYYWSYPGYTSPTWTAGGADYASEAIGIVSFDAGVGGSMDDVEVVIGDDMAAPTSPTAEGYRFLGWFAAPTGGIALTFPLAVTEDTVLYAQWEARVVTTPATSDPGDSVTITGSGFEPGESVEIWLYSTPVLLSTVSGSGTGTLSAIVVIPGGTAPGAHDWVLVGSVSGTSSNGFVLGGGVLAETGFNVWTLAADALLLMFAGICVMLAARGFDEPVRIR